MKLVSALSLLEKGDSIQSIAYKLGYSNPSAFIVMCRQLTACLRPKGAVVRSWTRQWHRRWSSEASEGASATSWGDRAVGSPGHVGAVLE